MICSTSYVNNSTLNDSVKLFFIWPFCFDGSGNGDVGKKGSDRGVCQQHKSLDWLGWFRLLRLIICGVEGC